MLRHVALVRIDVPEERSASIIRLRRLLVTANLVPSSPIVVILLMEVTRSSETLVLRRATWRNIPEDGILHLLDSFVIQNGRREEDAMSS
jgi:hypothetical protein